MKDVVPFLCQPSIIYDFECPGYFFKYVGNAKRTLSKSAVGHAWSDEDGQNKINLYFRLKLWANANGAGGSGGGGGFLSSKVPQYWLKIGLNLVKKLRYCLWEYHWKVNSEIYLSSYKLLQPIS